MGLPASKKTKSGYSTDAASLEKLRHLSPIIDEILEYRLVAKLKSTYADGLINQIGPDGKLHTNFKQALTLTGRLSSTEPNLQNIPIRTPEGRQIRSVFVPSQNNILIDADYSQIELRIMAHLSCDSHLIEAFRSGEDVHKATAAKIFGISTDEVTSDQRRIAKTANFGIMYGISAFGLSQRLGMGRAEAKKLIEDYFGSFPSVSAYIADTIAAAKECGYVETLFGRRRYLPDITSRNATVRSIAERNAVNAPIQGTSADIIKMAMIAVDKRLEKEGLRSRMMLQIHDELVFDAAQSEVDVLKAIVVEEMENVMKLSVPLTVECSYGKNWLEAK
jgi:DNA polymerase-1